jgi:response regulator RpfG family c-di-GMP phosphodiesterase
VPLQVGLECVGVVNVNNRLDGRPLSEDDRLLLESLAPRIGHLLARQADYRQRSRDFAALRESLRITIAVQRERCDRLTGLCHEICLAAARRLKLPQEELENLAFALRHYDVGLSRVSPQLLRKPGPLAADERELIRQHVRHGLEILEPLDTSAKVRQIIAHHHERCDGTGYPDRLEGEAIPVGARLLALADTLNALLQGRPYRPARDAAAALAEIEARIGSQFCPRLAGPFLREARACAERITAWQHSEDAEGSAGALLPAGFGDDGEFAETGRAGAPPGGEEVVLTTSGETADR